MLTRIRIKGYKSFHDVEVRLSPLAVMFGPNAAGKSNLLDAFPRFPIRPPAIHGMLYVPNATREEER